MGRWKKLRSLKGFTTEIIDTSAITTKEFVKNLRLELNLSQRVFASILGVSEKTVEKWEQGKNPVQGATSRLLYLVSKHNELISDIYKIKGVVSEKNLVFQKEIVETNTYSFCLSIKSEDFTKSINDGEVYLDSVKNKDKRCMEI